MKKDGHFELYKENKVVIGNAHNLFISERLGIWGERMGTNVKLNILEDVLKTVGIERVIKMIERGYDRVQCQETPWKVQREESAQITGITGFYGDKEKYS